jgi:hypothetical protein
MTKAIQTINASKHATCRAQQRGIPGVVLEWLFDYGERQPDHRGAEVLYFTSKSRQRIDRSEGSVAMRRFHEFMNSYAVVGLDGALITCGHRVKKIHRH